MSMVLDTHIGRDVGCIVVLNGLIGALRKQGSMQCDIRQDHHVKCSPRGSITGVTWELVGYADCSPMPGLLGLH